ncbi:ABC transporter permease [Streptomyces boncukensis]|uniref:ABC transporter permease n=1 Tax=Streptomyces boncukensis TaxID=2711219 RepID=UPI0013EA0DE7|nr:ABC transporter permease [Streptomyces boncukensis]
MLPRRWAATADLARAEGVRLLRHPALLGGLAVCLGLWVLDAVTSDADRYPVLHDEDRYAQLTLLVLAAGTFLAVHLAVLRPVRDEATDWHEAPVLEPWRRTAALLLSVLPAAVLAAVLAVARSVYLGLRPGAVGSPSASELAAGPAVVLLAGALAVLAGTWLRSAAAGPIVLGLLAIGTVAGALSPFASWRWWGLVAVEDESRASLPSELLHRPAAPHLLYLLCLAVVLGALALLRAGHRGRAVQAVAALALAGAVTAGAVQLRPVPESVNEARDGARLAPARDQQCTREGRVTYCAFPEFAERHRQWARVADGVLRWVPARDRAERYFVRQRVPGTVTSADEVQPPPPVDRWAADDRRAGTPRSVPVGMEWGSGSDSAHDDTIAFAAAFANRVTERRTSGDSGGTAPEPAALCGARGIVALWLAAQSAPEAESGLRSTVPRSFGDTVEIESAAAPGVALQRTDVETVLRLLDRPADDVAAKVATSWAELVDPDTPSPRAGELLGVRAPSAPAPADPEEAQLCPRA